MNDLKLAEEIERDTARYPDRCTIALRGSQWQQIIAALRRGPESWDAEVFRVKISEQLETIRELRQKLERPPSGEMVMLLQEIKNGPRKDWISDAFVQTESETNFNSRMMHKLRAMLSAAEAEGRKS